MSAASGSGGIGGVEARVEGAVLFLTLRRPEKANAYTGAMLTRLREEVERADADGAIRTLVLAGEGGQFSAGADRSELERRSPDSVLELASAQVFARLRSASVVTLALVDGAAVGGGMELALSCDIRLASTRARFWLPEPELGLLPAAGAIPLLVSLVGGARARELVLGGARWSGREALAAGLVSEVVEPGELPEAARRWTDRVERRDPLALRLAKVALAEAEAAASGAVDRVAQAFLEERARRTDRGFDT